MVLISVPDLRWLIRGHVLEQAVKKLRQRAKAHKSSKTASTGLKTTFYTATTHPLSLPPLAKGRQAGRQKAQAVEQTGGTVKAETSRTGSLT